MANLLPTDRKNNISKTLYGRLFLLIGSVLGVTGALVALAIAPTYIHSSTALRTQQSQLQAGDTKKTLQEKEEREQLVALRKRVDVLHTAAQQEGFTDTLTKVVAERPQGVSISTIFYTLKNGERSLTISGATPSRQVSQKLVQRLKEIGLFKDVSIPITALTRAEEGTFDVVMKGF